MSRSFVLFNIEFNDTQESSVPDIIELESDLGYVIQYFKKHGTFEAARSYLFVQACDLLSSQRMSVMKRNDGFVVQYMRDSLKRDEDRYRIAYFFLSRCNLTAIREFHRRLGQIPKFVSRKMDVFQILMQDEDLLKFLIQSAQPIMEDYRADRIPVEEAFWRQ